MHLQLTQRLGNPWHTKLQFTMRGQQKGPLASAPRNLNNDESIGEMVTHKLLSNETADKTRTRKKGMEDKDERSCIPEAITRRLMQITIPVLHAVASIIITAMAMVLFLVFGTVVFKGDFDTMDAFY
ncbi:hypothetical protein V6N13_055475 [Hibiscus sabdariffa]|uniref:Uncharacterized protein n=2 Tax=Hibiscus sabdariffa TaxID=183260 RepID=A0ABR2NTH8_9ROSI